MKSIELSAGWVPAMNERLLDYTKNTSLNAPSASGLLPASKFAGNGCMLGGIFLMKGIVPSSFTEIPKISSRSSDILCIFSSGYNNPADFTGSQCSVNPIVINTTYVAASASGTATWFWWATMPILSSTFNFSMNIVHNLYGTVGELYSGADLELNGTNIIVGQLYRISGLRLQIPTLWTFN